MKEEEKDKKYLENKQSFTVGLIFQRFFHLEGSTNIPQKCNTFSLKYSFEIYVLFKYFQTGSTRSIL